MICEQVFDARWGLGLRPLPRGEHLEVEPVKHRRAHIAMVGVQPDHVEDERLTVVVLDCATGSAAFWTGPRMIVRHLFSLQLGGVCKDLMPGD